MNFVKTHINVRSSIFGAIVTLLLIFATTSLLLPASSQSSTTTSQSPNPSIDFQNPEEAPSSTSQLETDESDISDANPGQQTDRPAASSQNTAGTSTSTQFNSTVNSFDKNPKTLQFVKGGFSQDGPVVSISSITNEVIPAGTCTYTFENTDYRKVTYTNRSSDRGCIAQMPVSLFPYSSDTWYFDGASYKADDDTVLIPARPQRSWPTTVVRSQDVSFANVSISPNSDMTSVNAYLNKKIPGTCTLRFTLISNPSITFTHTSPTIGPTEITEASNSGESMCGVALFYSSLPAAGAYTYQITFKDYVGYISTSTSGTINL